MQSHSAGAKSAGGGLASDVMAAQTPMTSYGTRLAERSKPSMAMGSDAAKPHA
ncbi:MAG: hypothetical protein RR949_01650 [Oscillospiraceae bacterium]